MEGRCVWGIGAGQKATLTTRCRNEREPAKSNVKGAVEYAKSKWNIVLSDECVAAYLLDPYARCPVHRNTEEPGLGVEGVHETAISEAISKNLQAFEPGLKCKKHQYPLKSGKIVDILCEDSTGNIVAIAVKKQDSTGVLQQLLDYMRELRKEFPEKKVRGIIMSNSYDYMLASTLKEDVPNISLKGYRIEVRPVSGEEFEKL